MKDEQSARLKCNRANYCGLLLVQGVFVVFAEQNIGMENHNIHAVSYTHLDVYKRQEI